MNIRTILAAGAATLALAACGNADDEAARDTRTGVERTEQALENAVNDTERMADQSMDSMGSGTEFDTDGASMGSGTDMDDMEMSFSLVNASGFEIGTVTIEDEEVGVEVDIDATSLPEGAHAVHFHENGTCDGPDFTSAGGHYNPSGVNHGFDAASPNPHAGDMRNIEVPRSGVVDVELDNERVTLRERDGLAPLLDANGTALIIHAGADDYESQPSGDAGGRIACAVISR